MDSSDEKTNLDEGERKVRSILYREPIVENLKKEFDLTEEIIDAAILIFRLFVGLGKGLSSSQKHSFAAVSVWYATRLINGKELSKEDLAKAVDVSPRTLLRRFNDLEKDEDSEVVLEYVKSEIKEWSKKREKRLQSLL